MKYKWQEAQKRQETQKVGGVQADFVDFYF